MNNEICIFSLAYWKICTFAEKVIKYAFCVCNMQSAYCHKPIYYILRLASDDKHSYATAIRIMENNRRNEG
jgi:hypothetical protein